MANWQTPHTPTPWTFERAKQPTDGEYDYAIGAVIDGKRRMIAEVFGRVADDIRPNAGLNAAFLVEAVNSYEALEDLASNISGLDDAFLANADTDLLRSTIREYREQARKAREIAVVGSAERVVA